MDQALRLCSQSSNQKKPSILQKAVVVIAIITLMGGSITGVMTLISQGYTSQFFSVWLTSLLYALVSVIPLGFLVMTGLTITVNKVMKNKSEQFRNAFVGALMAVIMESGMALTTVINTIGFSLTAEFFNHWITTLAGALPVALLLIIAVSMTIKPKVEAYLKR